MHLRQSGCYIVIDREQGSLGTYRSAEHADLLYARHIGKERSKVDAETVCVCAAAARGDTVSYGNTIR